MSRQRRPEARPAEIIEAARELFAERGFTATRLEDVASRAGLSKAAIYLYFKDKTDLLKSVVEATVGPNIEQAAGLLGAHQGPVAPLVRHLLMVFSGRLQDTRLPDVIKLVISESRAHPDIGRFYLDNVIGRALPLFEALIAKGVASGEFRPVDPALAVKCLVGPMLLGAIWRTVFEPLGAAAVDIRALADLDAELVLRGLRP